MVRGKTEAGYRRYSRAKHRSNRVQFTGFPLRSVLNEDQCVGDRSWR